MNDSDLEQELAKTSAKLNSITAELEAFTYSISHDLRSPLCIIEGMIQIIQQDKNNQLSIESQNLLSRIDSNAKKMNQQIDDLLRLSQITQSKIHPQEIDVSALCHQILSAFQNKNPTRDIECSIEPNIKINADLKLMSVVLEQLLDNALKFTSKKSKTLIGIGQFNKDGHHGIYIKDNGAGFKILNNETPFRPFKKYHNPDEFPGTGIGLALANRIIGLHNGRLWAKSKPGEGSTFYFEVSTQAK